MNSPYPRWTDPVRVHLQSGLTREFSCIYDALDFLENEWPTRDGALYARAIRLCREALDMGGSLVIPWQIAGFLATVALAWLVNEYLSTIAAAVIR